jgi:fructose-specific phosphotransferase system component IIB
MLRLGVRSFREFLKKTLPSPVVNWLRRWLGTLRYLRFLSHEVSRRQSRLETGSPLETLESRLTGRDGIYQQMAKEVLDRTDLVLQQLDRKIEGQGARHGEQLVALEQSLDRLRAAVDELKEALDGSSTGTEPERSTGRPAQERARRRSSGRRKLAASE